MCAVFRPSQGWRVEKYPRPLQSRALGLAGKAVSFGYFSLGQQRKVTRRKAEAFDCRLSTESKKQISAKQSRWI